MIAETPETAGILLGCKVRFREGKDGWQGLVLEVRSLLAKVDVGPGADGYPVVKLVPVSELELVY